MLILLCKGGISVKEINKKYNTTKETQKRKRALKLLKSWLKELEPPNNDKTGSKSER
jgi:hypothetical protein